MAENENLASILVKSGLNSIFTDSPIGYFSKFANELLSDDSNERNIILEISAPVPSFLFRYVNLKSQQKENLDYLKAFFYF